jgi:ATP-dependent RNA helicase DDX5/DBP2
MVHIQVGSQELSANTDITQRIVMTHGWQAKQTEITNQLWELDKQGITKVLVFAGTKKGCEELSNNLRTQGFKTGAIHGDKEQHAREKALANLKQMNKFVLCATDVAARGLDIPLLPAVINFDMPEQLEDYVHRIGRTGRAGNKGLAISFFTPAKDCGHAKKLIDILRKANQTIPPELEKCTMMTPPEKDRSKWGKKSGGGGGGKGGKGGGKGGGGWGRPY